MEWSAKRRLSDGEVVGDAVTLLSSCLIEFVVSGKGHKVPVSFLKGKDVGFYFYRYPLPEKRFLELKNMYEELRERGETFRLVFISCYPNEEYFNEYFKGTSLLAVPFSENRNLLYTRLNKLSDPYRGPELVIIRSGEHIAHTYAMTVFNKYGIEAYPFSKSILTEIEVARLKSLTLDKLFFFGRDYKFVMNRDGQEIPASHLVGKKILLFLTTPAFDDCDVCLDEQVIAWFDEIKRQDESFEMIRVLYNYNHHRGDQVPSYPWLDFPYNENLMKALGAKIFKEARDVYNFLPMFVTFGRNGGFISMTNLGSFIHLGKKAENFPDFFDDAHLYGEVRDCIAKFNRWTTVNEETGDCYVPW